MCYSPGCPPREGALPVESLSTCLPSPSCAAERFKQTNMTKSSEILINFMDIHTMINPIRSNPYGHSGEFHFTYYITAVPV